MIVSNEFFRNINELLIFYKIEIRAFCGEIFIGDLGQQPQFEQGRKAAVDEDIKNNSGKHSA